LVADLIKSNDRAVEVDDPFIGDLVLIWGPRGAALGTVASVVGGVPMILAFDEDERSGLFQPAELSILGYWRVD
jgi:hypothetical protein